MAYRHCVNCDEGNGLDKPEVEEDLISGSCCPYCGSSQPQALSLEEWMVEAFDRIKVLEKEVEELKSKLKPWEKLK